MGKLLFFLFLLSSYKCQVDSSNRINSKDSVIQSQIIKSNKDLVFERMKSKDYFNDTFHFSDFNEYLLFIPDINLPTIINTFDINVNNDTISYFLQGGNCNFGPSPCVPLLKRMNPNFVSIIYSGKTSGNELILFNYDYHGLAIDSFEIFKWEALGPMEEKCITTIDTNFQIKMSYFATQFKSYESNDTSSKMTIERILKMSKSGNILIVKNKIINLVYK